MTGPARRAAGVRLLPFDPVDEVHRHLRDDSVPDTIHVEVQLTGRADPERMRAAFHEALRGHPRALVREVPGRWYRRTYVWELTEVPDREPVVFAGEGEGALARARTRSLAEPPPLTASPPVRLEIVHLPGGTALVLAAAHTAMDALSCVRLLAGTAQAYTAPEHTAAAGACATPPPAPAAPRSGGGANGDAPLGARLPRRRWCRPVRVAAERGRPDGGDGMLLIELPVPRKPPTAPGEPPTTVNDVLLAATYLTVARWNRAHGRPTAPVRISMPVDDRAHQDAGAAIGNHTRLPVIDFHPEERDDEDLLVRDRPDPEALRRLLVRTACRTRAAKASVRPPLGTTGALLSAPWLPVGVKAPLTRAARAAGAGLISTTLFSNLGIVTHPLDFGAAGRARALWFSSPVRMPRGLTVTAATVGDRLGVAFCHSRRLLDDRAVAELSRLYTGAVSAFEALAPTPTIPAAGRTTG